VNALGQRHPKLVAALTEQSQKLWHCSNLYRVAGQERLAERLCEVTFADKVFFCNSGRGGLRRRHQAGAALSLRQRPARAVAHRDLQGRLPRPDAGDHRRGGNEKYLEGFGVPAPGFDVVPFGDLEAVEAASDRKRAPSCSSRCRARAACASPAWPGSRRCGRSATSAAAAGARRSAVRHGPHGKLFAHEWAGITPDVMAVAKGIGGGFPVGAFMATNEAAKGMVAGTHGSTYGGNPLAMAVGNTVLDAILEPGFLDHVQAISLRFKQELARLKDENPGVVEEVRGSGLLVGLKVKPPMAEVVGACMAEGLLTVGAGENVVRLLPPLNVSEAEIGEAMTRLSRALKRVAKPAA
jgi:acetylornithine/N-succinyldiaminopimelate aminotransferase